MAPNNGSSRKHSPTDENAPPSNRKGSTALTFYRDTKRQKKGSQVEKLRPISSDVKPLPALSKTEQKEKLAGISEQLDRNLQMVLWQLDCNYVLLDHQFLGVRRLAGVSASFPGTMKLKQQVDQSDEEAYEEAVFEWTVEVLENESFDERRGVISADAMGLGKTVQAVAACILRSAICQAQGASKKPSLIVSPNDAVLSQWHETLIKAGVEKNKIYRFVAKDNRKYRGNVYVLCNRYDLQTETRFIFGHVSKDQTRPESALFPHVSKRLLVVLKNQYNAEAGKAKNNYRNKDESVPETVIRYMEKEMAQIKNEIFRTVVIDEAHFLKNPTAYWGFAAALVGLHSRRMICMSGTPYNNSSQDLATLMSFIDPSEDSAREDWWRAATEGKSAPNVVKAVSTWNSAYLVRRDKSVIAKNLPEKVVTKKVVTAFPLELAIYEGYEANFLKVLEKFRKVSDGPLTPKQRAKQKFLHQLLISFASCMRMALIHPVLPSGGRDLTIMFSPSRKRMLKQQEKPNRCVCCKRIVKKQTKKSEGDNQTRNDAFDNLDDRDVNDEDEDFIVDDDEDEENSDGFRNDNKGEGGIVPIPSSICQLAGRGLRHFACESCLETMEETCQSCPQCTMLLGRLQLNSGREELLKKKEEAKVKEEKNIKINPEDMEIPRKIYCRHIMGGFRASAKLESIVSDTLALPKDEKILILSFFKGSLDLLEAMFHELNVEVTRFDGDVSNDEREDELERFKTEQSCRVMLMSVQTGGTGLNVTVANHVAFVDRFFNPFVHEQAEDRCYRLGQQRNVDVTYHDVSYTIDEVMRHINEAKTANASIILADGSSLTASTAGLSFKDISGVLGSAVRTVCISRINHVMQSQSRILEPLPPSEPDMFDTLSSLRVRGQFASLTDAIANMLGYVLPDPVPKSAPKADGKAQMDAQDSTASSKSGDLADDDAKGEIGAKGTVEAKVEPMEVVSGVEDVKPAVPKASIFDMLDDDSDDDSMPDAVEFKKK